MKKFNIPSFTNKIKLKRGTYSAIIIALVLVGIIAFNVLISIVSDRFKLEYDMTADKINTISDENIGYIESVENEVSVKICATENQYLQYAYHGKTGGGKSGSRTGGYCYPAERVLRKTVGHDRGRLDPAG